MFEYRCGVRLKGTAVNAGTLKILRKWFPDQSLAELRGKIQAHDYIYLSDMEKHQADGRRRLVKLLRELDKAGIETELFEEHRDSPAPWQATPMSRELLRNAVWQSREIERQTLENTEREIEGGLSQEAAALIEEEITGQACRDREVDL